MTMATMTRLRLVMTAVNMRLWATHKSIKDLHMELQDSPATIQLKGVITNVWSHSQILDHPKLQVIRYEHTLTSYRGHVGEDMWPGYEDHPRVTSYKD